MCSMKALRDHVVAQPLHLQVGRQAQRGALASQMSHRPTVRPCNPPGHDSSWGLRPRPGGPHVQILPTPDETPVGLELPMKDTLCPPPTPGGDMR